MAALGASGRLPLWHSRARTGRSPTTLNSPPAQQFHTGLGKLALAGRSWYVDETYVKIRGRWSYLYRAVDHP
jgi:hypothetical protein